MRSINLVAGVVGALLLSSAAAHAAETFGTFKRFCADTRADRAASLAAADAAGWITVNPSMIPIPPQANFKLTDYDVRMKTEGQAAQILLVGKGEATAAGSTYPAQVCMAIAKPGDADAGAKLKASAGMDPMLSQASGRMDLYIFEETPGGRKPIQPGAQGKAALASGRVVMLISAAPPSGGDVTALAYVKLKP